MTIVAIALGTSNTIIGILDPVTNISKTLNLKHISRTLESNGTQVHVIPSLVFVAEQGQLIFGEQARQQRSPREVTPRRLFQGFKRELIAEFRAPDVQIDGVNYNCEAIAELFLQEIWRQIKLQYQPTQVIFTVPVGVFEPYRVWFQDFARRRNLPRVQIVDESTAAALGYAMATLAEAEDKLLVVNFGGGSLDLSLVRIMRTDDFRKAEVIAKSDIYIGGIDIDTWIAEHHLQQLGRSRADVEETAWLKLLEISEDMKIQLSSQTKVQRSWRDHLISYNLQLNQVELSHILSSRQLIVQLGQALDQVLAIAFSKGISKAEIAQVLMVGGSSQLFAIQELVISYFDSQRVQLYKPFEAITLGALTLGKSFEVSDYLRHGYAIRLWDNFTRSHYYYPLFDQGTKYPCQRAEVLILQVAIPKQEEIRLDIGELANMAETEVSYDAQGRMTTGKLHKQADFRSLIDIHNIQSLENSQICIAHLNPPGEIGIDRLEVRFEVNHQRILLVTVKDLLTQKILVTKGAIAKLF